MLLSSVTGDQLFVFHYFLILIILRVEPLRNAFTDNLIGESGLLGTASHPRGQPHTSHSSSPFFASLNGCVHESMNSNFGRWRLTSAIRDLNKD
jgi:hypothetical protein